jgi:hypothetical protein
MSVLGPNESCKGLSGPSHGPKLTSGVVPEFYIGFHGDTINYMQEQQQQQRYFIRLRLMYLNE